MSPSLPEQSPDPRLEAWLGARETVSSDLALTALIEDVAMPVVRQTLGRKFAAAGKRIGASDDAEEAISRVREQLVRSAQRMREPGAAPVRDYTGYVAAVAQTVWAECLRRKYPARALLSHRLRYLLENRTGQTGFALWTAAGDAWCGFAAWRNSNPAPAERVRRLLVNPNLADDAEGDASSRSLPHVVARTLRFLGAPAPFADVLMIVAERLGVSDVAEPFGPEHESVAPDPAPNPEDALRWREYLVWLWNEVGRLPLRQRRAFLLHSTAAHDLEYGAVAGVRQQAAILELGPETFAEFWGRLPLDDLAIAALIGVTRQQVINLRKVARLTLGAAWKSWLHRRPNLQVSGHNG